MMVIICKSTAFLQLEYQRNETLSVFMESLCAPRLHVNTFSKRELLTFGLTVNKQLCHTICHPWSLQQQL